MTEIRAFRPEDLDDLYRICLATALAGGDASGLYQDRTLVGHVYVAPYAVLSPETVFVIEGADGVGGYIVGAPDTRDFEARLEAAWWPSLRTRYRDPPEKTRADWSPDELMGYRIHHPARAPSEIVEAYPAHLHINLVPHLRGRGLGRRLMERWLRRVQEIGSHGAHLAVGAGNLRAIRFYRACGFHELPGPSPASSDPLWFGIALERRI